MDEESNQERQDIDDLICIKQATEGLLSRFHHGFHALSEMFWGGGVVDGILQQDQLDARIIELMC